MKNKTLCLIASLILISGAFTSCKKDDETPTAKTKKEMLCKTWKIQEMKVNGTVDNSPVFAQFFFTYKTDGTSLVESPFGNEPGTWEFSSNETKLWLDKNDPEDELLADILVLTDTQLKVKYIDGDTTEMTLMPK